MEVLEKEPPYFLFGKGKIYVYPTVGDGGVALGFIEHGDEHEIGSPPDKETEEELRGKTPSFILEFENEESVDVVIRQLQRVKDAMRLGSENLKAMSDQELTEFFLAE